MLQISKLICFFKHSWLIEGHVIEGYERIGKGKSKRRKYYRYKHHRECQRCGLIQDLVRPKKYHPSKYIWKTIAD